MAGSYQHIMGAEGGWSLIEHMGDAHEAVEEMLWVIERAIGRDAAQRLLDTEYYPMIRGDVTKSVALLEVQRRMNQ